MAQISSALQKNEFAKNYKDRNRVIPKHIPQTAKDTFFRPAYYGCLPKKEEEDEEPDEWERDTLQNLGMDERDFY